MMLGYLSSSIQFNPRPPEFSIDEISSVLRVHPDFGTRIHAFRFLNDYPKLHALVPSVEFEAKFGCKIPEIASELSRSRPAIAYISIEEGHDTSHAIVLTGIDEQRLEISYNDPLTGMKQSPLVKFEGWWEQSDHTMIKVKIGARKQKLISDFSQKEAGFTMNVARSAALRYVLTNYGNALSVDEPVFDETSKTWVASIKSDYPKVIRNDRSSEPQKLRFLAVPNIGTIRLNENLRVVERAPFNECVRNLRQSLALWQARAEAIIVKASADALARLDESHVYLNPVLTIVSNLQDDDKIPDSWLEQTGREALMHQYLKLLTDLEIVKRVEGGYTYGNLMVQLQQEAKGKRAFETAVLSHLINSSYPILRDLFQIKQLERFIHVDSSYYLSAFESEEVIYMRRETIVERCRATYGEGDRLGITQALDKLVDAEALRFDHPYYFANGRIFSKMMDLKGSLPERSALVAGSTAR